VQITKEWRKSSRSQGNPQCVEVRRNPVTNEIEVRNSNRPNAGSVFFTDDEWTAFEGGVKLDEFNV